MSTSDLSFDVRQDFDEREHYHRRIDGWMGGPFVELPYFLSCLLRINLVKTECEEWQPKLEQFISKNLPSAKWIVHSTYFYTFAVLLVKHFYRESELGKQYPIARETKQHKVARFAILHPHLSNGEIARRCSTTSKQVTRNCLAQLALREYGLLNPEK